MSVQARAGGVDRLQTRRAGNAPLAWGGIAGAGLAALAIVLWLVYDVSVGEVALFVGFELAFVVVPGCLAYMALSGGARPALRVAVCGSAVGYALEVGAYILASATGVEALLYAYPPLVAAASLVALRRREGSWVEAPSWRPAEVLGAAAVAGAALVFLAVNLFGSAPLPGSQPTYVWYQDLLWQLAIAGEAKHVWPLDIPGLAGEPLRYHYFANLNQAAIGKTTGMSQALVNFRLAPVPLLLLVVGGLLELGRSLSGRAWGGVLCAALVLLLGRFDPLPVPPGEFFQNLYLSDSFLLGLALFLPLACELVDRIRGGEPAGLSQRAAVGPWVVVAILMLGCSGAKGTVLPVVLGGLGVTLAYALWRQRERVRAVAASLGLAGAALAVSYLTLYRGGIGGSRLDLVPLAIARRTPEYVDLSERLPDAGLVQVAANALGTAAGIVDVLAPLGVGLLAVCFIPRLRSRSEVVFLLGTLAVSLILWSLLVSHGGSQNYFLWYGWAAAGAVAAAAIVTLVSERGLERKRAVAFALSVGVALTLAVVAPRAYGPWSGSGKQFAHPLARLTTTKGVLGGLDWIREMTPDDSVIAVNNGYVRPDLARNCSYTAFSERRAMLECEFGRIKAYPPLRAVRSGRASHPEAERFRLNERIFRRGSPEAIRAASERFGVDYLVVDRRFAGARSLPRLDRVAARVYEGPRVVVYAVG